MHLFLVPEAGPACARIVVVGGGGSFALTYMNMSRLVTGPTMIKGVLQMGSYFAGVLSNIDFC